MEGAVTATIECSGRWFSLAFPYVEGAVAELKTEIPASLRAWHMGTKTWLVHESVLEAARTILVRHGLDVQGGEGAP